MSSARGWNELHNIWTIWSCKICWWWVLECHLLSRTPPTHSLSLSQAESTYDIIEHIQTCSIEWNKCCLYKLSLQYHKDHFLKMILIVEQFMTKLKIIYNTNMARIVFLFQEELGLLLNCDNTNGFGRYCCLITWCIYSVFVLALVITVPWSDSSHNEQYIADWRSISGIHLVVLNESQKHNRFPWQWYYLSVYSDTQGLCKPDSLLDHKGEDQHQLWMTMKIFSGNNDGPLLFVYS